MASAEKLETPVILVAMPQVIDPFFQKTVVLLVHHDEESSLGFILNRPTQIRLEEILENMKISWSGDPEATAFFGGPVQPELGSILFGATSADALPDNASDLMPGLAITQHIGDLEILAARPPATFRFFLGYAGWGAGQLIDEIVRNDWLTAPADASLLGSRLGEEAWEGVLRSVGVDPATLPQWSPADHGGEAN
ncbi:MAG TPA: YqgE/AlgH family protein [Thermoanaerobaculia bacterium]|nr:YqgE/AlgH family protein [Thermoanaerobaculia bacterium]